MAAARSRGLLPFLVLVALGASAPAATQASPRQHTLVEAPRELLGGDAALRTSTLAELRALGVRDLRVVMYWQDVAPHADARDVPGFHERDFRAYDWGRYGRAVDEAAAEGFRVLLTVSGPVPRWATAARKDHRTRPSTTHFRRFFEAVADRFGSRVHRYSVWNEPNHPRFLLPQHAHGRPVSGTLYRKLFIAARRGLKAAGQADRELLFGEMAPRGTSRVVAPLAFLRQGLCLTANYHRRAACNRLQVEGIAHHAYTTRTGPGFVPPRYDDVTIGVLPRLVRAVARAERAHAIPSRTPIDITEFGIQSLPDPFVGVSYTSQAEFRSISELLAYRQPRVRTFAQYLLRDDDPRPGPATSRYAGFESGLRGSDGEVKRAYDGFRLPLVARPVSRTRVALWGLVRPARGVTSVVLERRDGGGSWRTLKHLGTSARSTFSTRTVRRNDRRYRVRWAAPAGTIRTGPPTRVRHVR